MPTPTEQQALENTLKSPEEGGSAQAGGLLAQGANVPQVLEENPAVRQLLEESIRTQTGQKAGSTEQVPSPTVVTAAPVQAQVDNQMQQVDQAEAFLSGVSPALPPELPGLATPNPLPPLELAPSGLTTQQEKFFNDQSKLIDEQYRSAEESIRAQVDATIRETEAKQKQARGATSVALARMGALNVSSAGIQYVNDLTNTHNAQIADIRIKGEQLIQQARQARSAADLAVLSKTIDSIKENRDQIIGEQTAYLENVKRMQEIVKFQRDSASATIDAMATAGLTKDDVPTGYLENLDKAAGYAQGTSAGLLNVAVEEKKVQTQAQEIALAQNLRQLLDSTPLGERIEINGISYFGTSRDNIEVDELGYAKRFITNEAGEVIVQDLGKVGAGPQPQLIQDANGRPYLYDPQTKRLTYLPTFGSGNFNNMEDASVVWQNTSFVDGAGKTVVLEEGTKFNWYDKRDGDNFSGECGEFVRWATDAQDTGASGLSVGNSYESKLAKADKTIGTEQNPVRVGDVFMHSTGAQYGHIGIVNSVTLLDDGDYLLKFTESNVNLDGKITHTRTMKLSELKAKNGAFARYELRPELQLGSDNFSVPEFGETTEEGSNVSQFGRVKDSKYQTDAGKIIDDIKQDPTIKQFITVRNGYNTAVSIPNTGSNSQQQVSLIYSYMKLLDPDSVVREGEFNTATKYEGVLKRLGVKLDNIVNGKLASDTAISNIKNEVERMYSQRMQDYNQSIENYSNYATQFKIDPEDVLVGTVKIGDSLEDIQSKKPELSPYIEQFRNAGLFDDEIIKELQSYL